MSREGQPRPGSSEGLRGEQHVEDGCLGPLAGDVPGLWLLPPSPPFSATLTPGP